MSHDLSVVPYCNTRCQSSWNQTSLVTVKAGSVGGPFCVGNRLAPGWSSSVGDWSWGLKVKFRGKISRIVRFSKFLSFSTQKFSKNNLFFRRIIEFRIIRNFSELGAHSDWLLSFPTAVFFKFVFCCVVEQDTGNVDGGGQWVRNSDSLLSHKLIDSKVDFRIDHWSASDQRTSGGGTGEGSSHEWVKVLSELCGGRWTAYMSGVEGWFRTVANFHGWLAHWSSLCLLSQEPTSVIDAFTQQEVHFSSKN